MNESACGTMTAANAPCRTRAPTNSAGTRANPQSAEAMVKPVMPITNRRRRPYKSPRRPPVMRSTANESAYPATINWISLNVVARPRWMDGMATVTTLKSKAARNTAASITDNADQRREPVTSSRRGGRCKEDTSSPMPRIAATSAPAARDRESSPPRSRLSRARLPALQLLLEFIDVELRQERAERKDGVLHQGKQVADQCLDHPRRQGVACHPDPLTRRESNSPCDQREGRQLAVEVIRCLLRGASHGAGVAGGFR